MLRTASKFGEFASAKFCGFPVLSQIGHVCHPDPKRLLGSVSDHMLPYRLSGVKPKQIGFFSERQTYVTLDPVQLFGVKEVADIRGDRLRDLRAARKETQKQLADLLSITEHSVANYEGGRREPEVMILLKIARHYGVSGEYLAGLTDDPTRATSLPPNWEQAIAKAQEDGLSAEDVERAIRMYKAYFSEAKREG